MIKLTRTAFLLLPAMIGICMLLVSYRPTKKEHFILNGQPVAKTIMWISSDLPDFINGYTISWWTATAKNGEWRLLPGIHTREIVLIPEYIGKYIKCEVTPFGKTQNINPVSIISNTPVTYKGNPNVDWFRNAGVGVMLHFLKDVYAKDGGSKEYNDVVDGFNVEVFAENCKEAGANYVMLALGQNDGYYCSPNGAYDSIVGVSAGQLCSRRDLPADLFEALNKRGIRMMLYLPGNPPIKHELATAKFHYTYGKDSPTSQVTQSCWEAVIREWSLRYGKRLSGWWFDGMYRGGIIETRSDMSLEHNISTHTLAAKAGNYNSIVTYNYGVNTIQSNSPYDDYSAGEENKIVQVPKGRWVVDGVQWFIFTHLGTSWSKDGTRFKISELETWAHQVFDKEGVICFDINVTKAGAVNPDHIGQVKAVRATFNRISSKNK